MCDNDAATTLLTALQPLLRGANARNRKELERILASCEACINFDGRMCRRLCRSCGEGEHEYHLLLTQRDRWCERWEV